MQWKGFGGRLSIVIVTGAVLLVCPVSAQSVYDAADALNLLPTPREITLGDAQHLLADYTIVIPEGVPLARTGAEEINDRVTNLGNAPLPVMTSPPDGPVIYIGRWQDPGIRSLTMAFGMTLSPVDPGAQGYVIRFGTHENRPVILLGGSDAQGALYACVTFRRLIHRHSGRVMVQEAQVRDWPDFKIRNNGSLNLSVLGRTGATLADLQPLKDAAAALKEQIDFYLRHKVNYLYTRPYTAGRTTDPALAAHINRRVVEVMHYADERGINTRIPAGVEISDYLTPTQRLEAVERRSGTAYLYTAFEAHKRHAREYARFMQAGRGDVFTLHPYDGGGYLNPERWNEMGPGTRAMYGDDRARANLEQFLLYFDEIRAAVPNSMLEAVVYPYHYQFALPDFVRNYKPMADWMPSKGGWFGSIEDAAQARQVRERLFAYHGYLADHLDDDVLIVFREAGREVFLACGAVYPGHPINIWIYPDRNNGWFGTWCPQVRYAKTFLRSDMTDYYYVASSWTRYTDGRVQRLGAQEYIWNPDRPDGSAEFSTQKRFYEYGGREITRFQREHLIPRIGRILYGEAAGAYEDLIAANASLHYVADPEHVAGISFGTEFFDDTYKYMGEQAESFAAIYEDFTELAEAIEAGRGPRDPRVSAWTVYWYRFSGLAAAKAEIDQTVDQCRTMLQDGRRARAATLARRMLDQRLPDLARRCETVRTQSDALIADLPAVHSFAPRFTSDNLQPLNEYRPSDVASTFRDILRKSGGD